MAENIFWKLMMLLKDVTAPLLKGWVWSFTFLLFWAQSSLRGQCFRYFMLLIILDMLPLLPEIHYCSIHSFPYYKFITLSCLTCGNHERESWGWGALDHLPCPVLQRWGRGRHIDPWHWQSLRGPRTLVHRGQLPEAASLHAWKE